MKRFLMCLLLAGTALVFVSTHVVWLADLPERLATHFNASGKANGWMSRRSHGSFMLVFGLGVPAFILTLGSTMRFLPASLMNVPRRDYWHQPQHYPEACAIMFSWSQWQAAGLLVWMTLLNHEIVKANLLKPPHLSSTNTWALTSALLLSTGLSVAWMSWRFLKVPAHSAPQSTSVES